MKKLVISILFLSGFISGGVAQEAFPEKYGNTINLGGGIGYYGYVGHPLPVLSFNYELDVARNFTLAPFVGFFSYTKYYYWGSIDNPYRNYSYRETVMPVGVKGAYYFDQLFRANSNWDFYAAISTGFAFRTVVWENGYYGDKKGYQTASPLYFTAHAGAEYHLTQKVGIFLDLSTGVSTFGLAVHLQ